MEWRVTSYLDEPPQEIIDMAYKIGAWATQQGWKHWEIGPVADRAALAAERDRVRSLDRLLAVIRDENRQFREQLAAERETKVQ